MSNFKRFLSLVVALVMVIGMVPVNTFATTEEETCTHAIYVNGACEQCGAALPSEEGGDDEAAPEEGGDDEAAPEEGGDDEAAPEEGGEDEAAPEEGDGDDSGEPEALAEGEPVAKVGNTEYTSIDEAIANWTNGTTLTLLSDVTLSDVIKLNSTEHHILDLGTYTMTAAKNKDAIQYVVKGRSSASYALDIKADANNPGGITATGKSVVSHTKPLTGAPSKDRPITRFYGGVFNATYVVKQGGMFGAGYTGASAPHFYFYGGEYNGTISTNRSLNQFFGGTFNGNLWMSVDSSAYTLIAGGTFKYLSNLQGSELNSDKFTIGSAKGVYDKEVYVDDNGNYVIAAAEPSEGIEAEVAKNPGTNDYLKYSKVGTEGQLGYTDVATALKNNTSATVTVYADELDMSGINFTGTIVVPEGETLTITNAPEGLKTEGNVVIAKPVAKIGEQEYLTLKAAINEAQNGQTITLLADIEQADGVLIDNKNITVDLNGKTFTVTEGASTNNRNFKIIGSSVVTIKNGTMVAKSENGSGAYGTVRTEGTANVTLTGLKLYNYRGGGLNVKACSGTTVTIYDSEIYAQYGGGVEASAGNVELNNTKIEQKGVYGNGWYSVAMEINDGGSIIVNSGEYFGSAIATDANAAKGNSIAFILSSGGTLTINDGTFTGIVSEEAQAANFCGLIYADRAAVVNINGGTFNSNGAILDMRNNAGTQPNPVATLAGGTFSADPRVSGLYSSNLITVAEGFQTVENDDGTFSVEKIPPVAKIGEQGYMTLAEAVAAIATDGSDTTIKLLTDIELTESIVFNYGTGKVTFTADEPVTVKQTKVGLDLDISVAKAAQFVIGENVTFEIYDNASGMYMYYGPSLTLNGTITGGQNWGCLYLFNGEHTVTETGKIGVGRVQLASNKTTVEGEVDTNYLLVEGATFTADGAKVDANVIFDNNNGSQRWGASQFAIKNGSEVTTNKLTLSYADSTLTIDTSSSLAAAEIAGNGKIIIDGANFAGNEWRITGNASNFAGTIEIINNPDLKYVIDESGNIVVKTKNYVAQIGEEAKFETLQAAINAAQNGQTITLLTDIAEDVTVAQAADVKITIDGADKTMTGTITVDGKSNAYATAGLTIKNVNFNATGIATDACINLGVEGDINTRYTSNVAVENCSFTGGNREKVAISSYTGGDKNLTVTGCTVDNTMHSLLQVTNVNGLVIDGCIVNSKNGINLNSSENVVIENSTISVSGYAVRAGANEGTSGMIKLTGNTLKTTSTEDAVIIIRGGAVQNIDLTMEKNVVSGATHISGTTADTNVAADMNYWDGKAAPVVKGTQIDVENYYADEALTNLKPTKLAGSGTAADPYLINNLNDLILFRDNVDKQLADGTSQYAGKYFKLTADIDLAGINWNPIGSMSGDHGSFKGVFDGDGHIISNLNVQQAGNGLGLFAYTAGNAEIKNLTLNNVTVKSTNNSNYVGGLVGNAYASTKITNVHVTGNIDISGRGYIGGISGHGYVVMDNVSVVGTGTIYSTFWCAGGILGYGGEGSTNIKNAHVEGITITSAAGGLGAIVGMAEDNDGLQPISGSNLSAKDVVIKTYTGAYGDAYANYALGYLYGGNPTSKLTGNLSAENVKVETSTGVEAEVNDAVAVADGKVYFDLQTAVNAGGEVKMARNITLTETLVVPAGTTVTLDLNGKTISGTHGSEYAMIHVQNGAKLTINDTSDAKTGKITCAAGGNNIGANIWVEGALVQNGGTIEVTGSWTLGFAVDLRPNAWGTAHTAPASFVMNGGVINSTDTAVRVASNSSDGYEELGVNFTMNGGTIDSDWDAIFVQHLYKGDLNIEVVDGTISGDNSVMRIYGDAGSDIDMNVKGGNFTGVIKVADAYVGTGSIAISGGTFSAVVTEEFCAEGYIPTKNADGTYGVKAGSYVARNTTTGVGYETLQDALKALKSGDTLDLLQSVTISEKWDARYTGGKISVPVTINGNGNTIKFTGEINDQNYFAAFRFEADATVKNLTMDLSECTSAKVRAISAKGNLTVDNCKFIGNGATNNNRAIIFGEGAGAANIGNVTVSVTNSTFKDWRRGLGDNENAQNAKSVTATGNTFTNAGVNVSANEAVTFTDNTVTDTSVIITSYNGYTETVTVTGNTLNNVQTKVEKAASYHNIQGDFSVLAAASVVHGTTTKYFNDLAEAINNADNGAVVTLYENAELTAPMTVKKSITIDGNGKKITQSADCKNDHALLYFDAADVLDVTVMNVTFDGIKGGAAIRTLGANMTIDNCVFQNGEHTQVQGLVRLTQGKAVIKDSKFLNNNCSMAISFNYDTSGLEGDTFEVENCVFEGNTANTTALVYYVKGAGCTMNGNQFKNNVVNCNSNGATIYLGFQENCVVTNNLFENNTVKDVSASTRVAGAIFFGHEAEISGNAFINNTASNANGDTLGQLCTSTYYEGKIDLSGNYWGGAEPVYGKDYTIQHQTGNAEFVLDNYYTVYSMTEDGVALSGEVNTAYVAQIGKQYFKTINEALEAAVAGDTVTIKAGTYTMPSVKAGITIEGDGEVLLEGTLSGTLENLTLKNLHIKGGNAQRWAYAKGNLVFENVTFEATGVYAVHFDGITAGTTLKYKDCTIIGWAAMSGSPESCVFEGCTFKGNGSYGLIRTYFDATIEDCTFDVANVNTNDIYQDGIHAVSGAIVTVNNCTNVNGNMTDVINVSDTSVVKLDGVNIQNVAKIGDNYYGTLDAAFASAKSDDTITMLIDGALTKEVVLDGTTLTVDGSGKLTLDDNLKVKGETTLNITAPMSGEVWLDDGAIVVNSNISGDVFVAGNVTFRGANSVNMLYDYGTLTDNYGTVAPMQWTVEKGASLTVNKTARYGLGYGDKVTIIGNLTNAKRSITPSLFMHGLVAQESKGWNCDSSFTVKDAYVVIGQNNSFGNKPGNYGGTYTFTFENARLDASRITFYEALSTTNFSFTDSNVKTGTFMTNDADSVFTLTNTKLLSTTTSNGTDEGNYNAGILKLTNSELTYSAAVTNKGTIEMDVNSILTAPAITGAGKIVIDATGYTGSAKTIIAADLSGYTGTIEVKGAVYQVTAEGIVVDMATAIVGEYGYASVQAAIDACVEGDNTVTILKDTSEDVTIAQKEGVNITIDGNDKTFSGTMYINGGSNYGSETLTIKNVQFETTESGHDFIWSDSQVAPGRYAHNVTVVDCDFAAMGAGKNTAVGLRFRQAKNIDVINCTASGMHSLMQINSSSDIVVDNASIVNCKNGVSFSQSDDVTVKNSYIKTIGANGYGIRGEGYTDYTMNVESCDVIAYIPVLIRKATGTDFTLNISGDNTMKASNEFIEGGAWAVISKNDASNAAPEAPTGTYELNVSDTGLDLMKIYPKTLNGSGTAEDPYLINTVEELILFRDSVNAGETKYNAPGVVVALGADIDMADATWERGIGDGINATFDGIFDGNNKTIKNLNMAPKADSDGYICGGLFGYTYGAAEIKNLVLENITVTATDAGHNVGALVGFAYNKGGKLTVSNISVKNVTVDAPNAYGVGAIVGYSYYEMETIENCSVDVATITGYSFVGGIAGYSDAEINKCSVNNATITATSKGAGGIAGLAMGGDEITNNTVANTTVTASTNWGYVVGELGNKTVVVKDNNAAEPQVGGDYATGEPVEAKIDDTYYTTFEAAYAAASAGKTIELLAPIVVAAGETLSLAKDVTITYTSNVPGEDMITVKGNLEIDGATLIYKNTDTTASNVTVSTISAEPGSNVVINSGAVKNVTVKEDGSSIYSFAIDLLTNGNLGDVTVTINDGTVYSDYMAIRQFNNGTACKNTLNVTGGYIYGAKRAIQVHMDNTAAYTTISGGKVEGDYALCIFSSNNENLTVTGGEFIGSVYSATEGFISGGTFNAEPYVGYIAEGCWAEQNTDGTYGVVESVLYGTGTQEDPYMINNLRDLILFRDSVNAGKTKYNAEGVYVALGANIDMAGIDWSVNIGDDCNATFDGIFDGKGYTISNLTSTETAAKADGYVCTGLFGAIYGNAVIKNLTIDNANITAEYTGNNAGIVVGFAYNCTGSIENVHVTNSNLNASAVTGTGAIVGYDYYGTLTISGCSVKETTVTGQSYVGGIIGYGSNNCTVQGSEIADVTVTANGGAAGGIAGIMLDNGKVANTTINGLTVEAKHENWKNSAAVAVGAITSKVTVSDITVNDANVTELVGAVSADKPTAPVAKVAAKIGNTYYTTWEKALAAAKAGETIELLVPITVESGKTVEIDLAGKVITGTDAGTASFGLINNKGTLTINDSVGGGKITLNAINNRGWNAYSSVISNQPGGKLTVNGGTIEHLGGTDMAYGIDNLTNGKGTYAETVINGGTVKSTYRAIRQFLNGIEAKNILTVNGGTIEGANKSIWMQDPSKNANTGTLTVGENATLNGDVYLFVTAGSTEWPVEVSIAASAVNGEVISGNVPATYVVENVNGIWGVYNGLKGSGTAEDPYLINTVEELILFRDSVNAGETKYNAPGVVVALGADIDMAGAAWERGIGDGINATFDGIFDGNNKTIKNLNMAPKADSDGYICGGLFGYTYGAVEIKNLVLENITVKTDDAGHNVGALVGFANNKGGKLTVSNISVKNVTVDAPNAYGVGAIVGYSYRTMGTIENCSVDGATIKGYSFVGGITGYSYSGAAIDGCSVNDATITATSKGAGGIVGLAQNGEVVNNTVTNTTVTAPTNWGYVVGELGADYVLVENNTAAEPQIGGNYADGGEVEAKIGNTYYTTWEKALAAAKAGETIELLVPITVESGKTVEIDLAGKIITGTDAGTASFGLINNKGTLTINDSVGGGKITLNAINNRGWNAYSSVISNQPGGKLTVNGGTIEHLGGTDMAYGIDNLTNGKGTYAETIINGGTVKSTYRAIRQFLNGTDAENILIVNGGTIEGTNKSIWMQDPSKNANTGTLTVGENATLKGDVYLFVTAGSTEWPVEVSIAAAALSNGSNVVTGNLPTGHEVPVIGGYYVNKHGVAKIGNVYYETFDAAYTAAKTGDVIELFETVVITNFKPWINYSKKNITVKAEFGAPAFRVQDGAYVWFGGMTIESDDYCIIVGASDSSSGATVEIYGGTYKGATSAISVTKGDVKIMGGNFSVEPYEGSYEYTINCVDAAYKNGDADVSIQGGNFYNFNPGNNAAEGAGTNFLVGGYCVKNDNGYYVVDTHKYVGVYTEPTFDADGYTTYTCAHCGDSYVENDDGTQLIAVAKIGDVRFETLQAAINAAQAGDNTITLLADSAEDVTIKQVEGVNITIDGGNNVYSGTITIHGGSRYDGAETLTIQNVKFETSEAGHYFIDSNSTASAERYAHNVTVKNSSFTATDAAIDSAAAMRIRQGFNIAIDDVTATGMHSLFQGYGVTGLSIDGVKATDMKNGISAGTSTNVSIKNVEIEATGYGIRADGSVAATLAVENATINAAQPIVVRKNSNAGYAVKLTGTNALTGGDYDVTFTTGEDGVAPVAPTHAVNVEGAENLNVFPVHAAKIGETYFTTVQAAINAAQAGDNTITLLADSAEDVTVKQAEGVNITIDGGNNVYSGTITIHGDSRYDGAETLTIKNVKFETSEAGHYFIDSNSTVGAERYAHNVTVIGSTFTATDAAVKSAVAMRIRQGFNIVIKDVKTKDMHSLLQAYGIAGIIVDGVDVNGKNGISAGTSTDVVISNANITATGYGIRADGSVAATLAVENATINAAQPIVVRYNTDTGYAVKLTGTNALTGDEYDVTFTTGEDGVAPVAPAHAVNVEGAENLKVFPVHVAKIGETYYATLAEALSAAKDGETITLIWTEGNAPIAMNGSVFGKSVTITGTAKVDWSKGFLFVGRGGEGDGTVIFEGANLTSASNSASYGIHVSGREKNTNNKYDGTLVINNSNIELDYLINKGVMTLDNSTLTVKNGFAIGGRPASETESGADATATLNLTNNSKVVVNNHNGMGLGYEAIGVMNIDATSSFETTQSFLVTAKGTMNIAGTAKVADTLTNKGSIVLTDAAATLTSSECGNVTTSVSDDHKVVYADGAYKVVEKVYVAKIGDVQYEKLSEAIKAAKAGDTITFLADINENVVVNKNLTIEGAEFTYTGKMEINTSLTVTVQNVNFVKGSIYENKGAHGKLTVKNCDFDSVDKSIDHYYAVTMNGGDSVTMQNCTAKNYYYGMLYAPSTVTSVTVQNAQITDCTMGINITYGGKALLENVKTNNVDYGVQTSNFKAKNITIRNCELDGDHAICVYDRNTGIIDTFIFEGKNIVNALDNTGNAKYVLANEEATLTAPEGATVTTTVGDDYKVVYENGTYKVVKKVYVAQIGDVKYEKLSEAIKAAKAGDTIIFLANINENVTIDKNLTIDGNNKQYTYTYTGEMKMAKEMTVTVKNVNFVKGNIETIKSSKNKLTVENCNFDGADTIWYAVTMRGGSSVTIKNCTAKHYVYDMLYVPSSVTNVTVKDTQVTECRIAVNVAYGSKITLDNVKTSAVEYGIQTHDYGAKTITIRNCDLEGNYSVFVWARENGKKTTDTFIFEGKNIIRTLPTEYAKLVLNPVDGKIDEAILITPENTKVDITTNAKGYQVVYDTAAYKLVEKDFVAQIVETSEKFETLNDAFKAAQNGETVQLIADIDLSWADVVTNAEGYTVLSIVDGNKSITLDMNGKTISVDHQSTTDRIFAVICVEDGASLKVTGNGTIDVDTHDETPKVAYMFWKRGTTGTMTIENGYYHMDNAEDSMVYTNGNRIVTVEGGTFILDANGTRVNGFPWIFNAAGNNERAIIVKGGTYNYDVRYQHWKYEVSVNALAVRDNGDGTYTLIPAVASIDEGGRQIGFATLNEAIVAANGTTVTLLKDTDESLTITGNVIIDVNGNDINGTITLADAAATLTAQAGLENILTIDNHRVVYENGTYKVVPYVYVAQIGDVKYESLAEAVEAAQDGDTVKVIADHEVACDHNPLITVANKNITIDLNGHKIEVNAVGADEVIRVVFATEANATLTMTDSVGTGLVDANGKDIIYYMFRNAGTMTIEGGNYELEGFAGGAMFFSTNSNMTVTGGKFTQTTKGWMFNTDKNGVYVITVSGGTFNRYFMAGGPDENQWGEVVLEEGKALVKADIEGYWTIEEAVAKVVDANGETVMGYATLAEAIAAADASETVVLLKDIELTEGVVVESGKTVTLDLNGKTVSMEDASAKAAALLTNNGTLTIQDSVGTGKLSFTSTNPSAANSYASNTISNHGTLTIVSGTIENNSVGGACYALDNYAGSTATINGGNLTAEKTAVRVFNWTNGDAAKSVLNVNGGSILSKDGYGINFNLGNAPTVELNVTGGTITTNDTDYNLAAYIVNKGRAENVTVNVTGGTFDGAFALNGMTCQTMADGKISIRGGFIEEVICYEDPAYAFISGGVYDEEPKEAYIVKGCEAVEMSGNNDYYVIVKHEHPVTLDTDTTNSTCTVAGSIVITVTCDTCGDPIATETVALPLAQHVYVAGTPVAPTCTEAGYTVYTCACDDSYESDIVNATGHTEEIIPEVKPTCTTTGLTAGVKCSICGETLVAQKEVAKLTAVAYIVETDVQYAYLDEALAAADAENQTVKLLGDLDLTVEGANGTVIIPAGVTLDIEAHTLKANYVVGVNGSFLIGTTDDKNTAEFECGILAVPKEHLVLSKTPATSGGMAVLPVWNDTTGWDTTYNGPSNVYLFAQFKLVTSGGSGKWGGSVNADEDTLTYRFRHQATGKINKGLLGDLDGADNNAVQIVIRVEYETSTGVAYENFVYNAEQVDTVSSANNQDYTFVMSGYKNHGMMTVRAMIITESGAVLTGPAYTVDTGSATE